jgi:hypothetical protein
MASVPLFSVRSRDSSESPPVRVAALGVQVVVSIVRLLFTEEILSNRPGIPDQIVID